MSDDWLESIGHACLVVVAITACLGLCVMVILAGVTVSPMNQRGDQSPTAQSHGGADAGRVSPDRTLPDCPSTSPRSASPQAASFWSACGAGAYAGRDSSARLVAFSGIPDE